jgi:hypothetical protein
MDLTAILRQLRDQLDGVNQAITSVEALAAGQKRRRGRPPAWMKRLDEAKVNTPKRGKAPKIKETV